MSPDIHRIVYTFLYTGDVHFIYHHVFDITQNSDSLQQQNWCGWQSFLFVVKIAPVKRFNIFLYRYPHWAFYQRTCLYRSAKGVCFDPAFVFAKGLRVSSENPAFASTKIIKKVHYVVKLAYKLQWFRTLTSQVFKFFGIKFVWPQLLHNLV